MTMQAFQPKADQPEWRILYDALLAGCEFGDTITFEQFDDALGREFRANRKPLYRAMQELLESRHRTLAPVFGKGYRVVEPREHGALARSNHRSARRQLRKAHTKVAYVERSKLTAAERAEVDALQVGLARQEQMVRRLDAKVTRQQEAIDEHRAKLSDVDEMRERMERLEGALRERGFTTGPYSKDPGDQPDEAGGHE